MFNPKTAIEIRRIVDRMDGKYNQQARDRLIGLAIARAVSVALPMPSSPVLNLIAYYASTHNDRVCQIAADINENYIIDTKFVVDMTYKLYRLRYRMAYEAKLFSRALFAAYMDDDTVPQDLLDMAGGVFDASTNDVMCQLICKITNSGIQEEQDKPAVVAASDVPAPTLSAA